MSGMTEGKPEALKVEQVLVAVVSNSSVTPWTVCSLAGSSVHGILQARILEWVIIPFSRGSSQSRG